MADSTALSSNDSAKILRPIVSPEHGVYVMLLVAGLTGAAAAQQWTRATTLAMLCAFFAFQAEHPLVMQIRQRKTWKPRFLVWGGLYGVLCLGLAFYLGVQTPTVGWLYLAAALAALIDGLSVVYRQQKSVANELIVFAAVCLVAPMVVVVTQGVMTPLGLGLWLLNAAFFGGTIFTIKLRKRGSAKAVLAYHTIALLLVAALYGLSLLPLITALAFGITLLKMGLILWQKAWYLNAPIGQIAALETTSALLFGAIAILSLLPPRLGI
jgi:hypothetical protein